MKRKSIGEVHNHSPMKRVKKEAVEDQTEPENTTASKIEADTLYDDIIFIKVGPSETKFGIHRGLLIKTSGFFNEILGQGDVGERETVKLTQEGENTVIMLEDEDPTLFSRVNHWLYSGCHIFRKEEETWKSITWDHLIGVYLLSVKYGMARLHNTCITATIHKTKKGGIFPNQANFNKLWRLDVRAEPLRKLFVKLFASRCDLKSAVLNNRTYNQTFLNWLVIELYEMKEKGVTSTDFSSSTVKREYHVHGSDNPIAID